MEVQRPLPPMATTKD